MKNYISVWSKLLSSRISGMTFFIEYFDLVLSGCFITWKRRNFIFVFVTGCALASCSDDSEMFTIIHPDGSCTRKFVESVDSAFMVGDTASSNPFPVTIDSSWQVWWWYDSLKTYSKWPIKNWNTDTLDEDAKIRAAVQRNYSSVTKMELDFRFKPSHQWNDIKPKYEFDKKFRWFYTYFEYKETYPRIRTLEVPIEKFMTKEEARLWFNGDKTPLNGMNGIEVNDYMDQLDKKFNKWFAYSYFDGAYDVYIDKYEQINPKDISKKRFIEARDSVFHRCFEKYNLFEDINVGECLDIFFRTDFFASFFNQEYSPLKSYDESFDDQYFFKYFETHFNYHLIMPGEIMESSDAVIRGDTLFWKLDGYRLVYEDYEIFAKSRKPNRWAFIVSILIVLMAVASCFIKLKS